MAPGRKQIHNTKPAKIGRFRVMDGLSRDQQDIANGSWRIFYLLYHFVHYLFPLKHIKIFKAWNRPVFSKKIILLEAFVLPYFCAIIVDKVGKGVER